MLENPHSTSFGGVHTVQLPETLEATYAIRKLMLRPFGIDKSDLEVDFDQPSRPALVTDLLECCTTDSNGRSPDRNLLWELNLSTRIEYLLRIVSLSGAFDAALSMRCLNGMCGEVLELELSLDELLDLQRPSTSFISVECNDQTLRLRKPSGLDQREWAAQEFKSEHEAIESIVKTLLVRDSEPGANNTLSLDDDSLATIDRVMEESDPLINFRFEIVCPYCESHSDRELDLQALAIERLTQLQRGLLITVHQLARHYHWTEEQIFAVPSWRRTHYLKLLDEN